MPTKEQLHQMWEVELEFPELRREDDPMYIKPKAVTKFTGKEILLNYNGATFSDCRNYRYKLWRIWDTSKPLIAFMGINPSTANETEPDNTIKRVMAIAKHNGFGGIYMINLFGLVSTDPDLLLTHPNPIGDNDKHIDEVQGKVWGIVCAWGAFKQAKKRAREVYPRIGNPLTLLVLKDGSPKHPLYCKKTSALIPFKRVTL